MEGYWVLPRYQAHHRDDGLAGDKYLSMKHHTDLKIQSACRQAACQQTTHEKEG